jgi:hypothetical protein
MLKDASPEQHQQIVSLSEKTTRQLEDVYLTCVRWRKELEAEGASFSGPISNVLEFALLTQFELMLLQGEQSRSTLRMGPNFFGRVSVLIMYEGCRTLKVIMGKEFQADVDLLLGKSQLSSLRKVHSQITSIFKSIDSALGPVRHGAIAHKDASAQTRLDLLHKSSVRTVADYLLDFAPLLHTITNELLPYLNETYNSSLSDV